MTRLLALESHRSLLEDRIDALMNRIALLEKAVALLHVKLDKFENEPKWNHVRPVFHKMSKGNLLGFFFLPLP